MANCGYCSAENATGTTVCVVCGAALSEHRCEGCATVYTGTACPGCGMAPGDTQRTCTKCGSRSHKIFCPACGANMLEGVEYVPTSYRQPPQANTAQAYTAQPQPQRQAPQQPPPRPVRAAQPPRPVQTAVYQQANMQAYAGGRPATAQTAAQAPPVAQTVVYHNTYNNTYTNVNSHNNTANVNHNTKVGMVMPYRKRNKWVSLLLCLLVGVVGAHKFYEGKIGMGLLYLFTGGLFGIGWLVDFIALLFKPNPYFIKS